MSPPLEDEGTVTFTVREILDGINEKLAKTQVLVEQQGQRVNRLEARVDAHDRILTEQIPKFQKVLDDLNVQQQVEAALDSRKLRGIGTTDRIVASAIGLCILALAALAYLPHVLH